MTSTAQALPGARIVGALDQLDLVAVRVGDKGDHGAAALDRAGLARHVAAGGLDLVARGVRVGHVVVDGAIDTEFIRTQFPERYALKSQDGILKPDHIAENYWYLHTQPRDAWTFELDLRPYMETW